MSALAHARKGTYCGKLLTYSLSTLSCESLSNHTPNSNTVGRDAGTGGGAVGATCPHNLEAVGASPPQLWTVNVVHFYFCLILHENLGLSKK